jgi:response regulator NasT
MNDHLRIAIADDEADMRDYFQRVLPILGHKVVGVAGTGRQLIEQCRGARPDLIITDIRMPDMDGIDAAAEIGRETPLPAVLVSAHCSADLLERVQEGNVMAYLIKPIKQADLEPAIALAMARFAQFQAVSREATNLRQALEDRKFIERAKGVLMRKAGLNEQEAFRRLQRLASDKNKKLIEIAHVILTAEEAFRTPDGASRGPAPHPRP